MRKAVLTLSLTAVLAGSTLGAWLLLREPSNVLLRTPECAPGQPSESLPILVERAFPFNQGKTRGELVPKGHCYGLGLTEMKGTFIVLKARAGLFTSGVARITGIIPVDSKNTPQNLAEFLEEEDGGSSEKKNGNGANALHMELERLGLSLSTGFYLVLYKKVSPISIHFERGLPLQMDFAERAGRPAVDALLKQGAVWIYVGTPEEFASQKTPEMKNSPYVIAPSAGGDMESAMSALEAGLNRFDLASLPKDRNQPVILTGKDSFDMRVLLGLITAQVGGWKKLYWYLPEESEASKAETPGNWPGIATVSPVDAKTIVSQGGIVVDTRDPGLDRYSWNKRVRIKGSTAIPYKGKDLPSKLIYLNLPAFNENRDMFDVNQLPADKNTPLIFYGEDRYDWNAMKAAIWASSSGWQRVHWLRQGIAGWRSFRFSYGNGRTDYPVEPVP